jgi:hypothetical protein
VRVYSWYELRQQVAHQAITFALQSGTGKYAEVVSLVIQGRSCVALNGLL